MYSGVLSEAWSGYERANSGVQGQPVQLLSGPGMNVAQRTKLVIVAALRRQTGTTVTQLQKATAQDPYFRAASLLCNAGPSRNT
jgi:hypothetical protein